MKIAIIGGTGYTGGNIALQALKRGWEVSSLSRNEPTDPIDGVEYVTGSYADAATVERFAAGADALVLAVHAVTDDGTSVLVPALQGIAYAAAAAGARLGVVGGAGSSYVSDGGPRLFDTPEFQEAWKPEATTHATILEWLEQEHGADDAALSWFYVSPAALYGSYAPGEETGAYRVGGHVLVTKSDGSSEISGPDFALAFVDELATPAHQNRRFTVGH
ncbi:NAD(P)H-binding protein [Planctomonas sp. JC2975]|uniref:NAD(P)-dependent oxidoreductase n=1 Tax=Planctomonas sp. JC2975 TaxID=2729626 RepID=UPI00147408BE|nr:NAD(P)H-binding protein [Planctomonas sp. JC2975]NNC11514.1 NAD(P)H-binding protein [Planctomonas sp. JC2975]